MGIIQSAMNELKRINFGDEDSAVMIDILKRFLEQWDSGGAVHAVAPIFQRLLAGKPISPLTGEADEWFDHGDGMFQNIRAGSVFKDPRFHDGKLAYDLDNQEGARVAITFPYWPLGSEIASPVIEIDT